MFFVDDLQVRRTPAAAGNFEGDQQCAEITLRGETETMRRGNLSNVDDQRLLMV